MYRITIQRELRREFWRTFPHLSRRKVKMGDDMVYLTDTRVAFVGWVDRLQKDGVISEALAQRATL